MNSLQLQRFSSKPALNFLGVFTLSCFWFLSMEGALAKTTKETTPKTISSTLKKPIDKTTEKTAPSVPKKARILLDRLEASVNSDTILRSDIGRFRRSLRLRAQIDPLFAGSPVAAKGNSVTDSEIISFLENERIITQTFPAAEAEVEQEIRTIQTNNRMDRNRLKAAITEQGFFYEDYFELIRSSISKKSLIDRDIRSKVNISDDDIKNFFYNKYVKTTTAPRAYQLQLIHVTVSDYKTPTDAYDAINRAKKSLAGGDSFDEVAKRFNSGASLGDLGVLTEDQMSEAIKEQAKKLKIGEFSSVFGGPSAGRYMILKLKDVKSGESDRLDKMKDEIRAQLVAQEYQHQISLWIDRKKQASFIHFAGESTLKEIPVTQKTENPK